MATSWFTYSGSVNVHDPLNYSIVSGNPICLIPKVVLCAIFAEIQLIEDVERPIITGALQTEINNAILSVTESINVRLKPERDPYS